MKNMLEQPPFSPGFFNKWRWRLFILLGFLFIAYCIRLYQVEFHREGSQGGFARVLGDVEKELKPADIWPDGIGCAYWIKLRNCIGIEILSSAVPSDISNQIDRVANNFCDLVEKIYPKEIYRLQPMANGAVHTLDDLALAHAYFTFFDCDETRKPIGNIVVYINPSGVPYDKPEWVLSPKLTKIYPLNEGEK
ncbi:hypothetical protein [Candidatus Ferrigenium straubiae]|jgi:hypothetical protein|uniref:hypothetical protein n=1 Tax=Candidatus Ferrigenium straubiae TaxID=2919506 RepID=UPI003F4ABC2A